MLTYAIPPKSFINHCCQQQLCAPDISSSLKPLILIPPISTFYRGYCKMCRTIYHPSYYEVQKEQYLYDLTNQRYLQISSQTVLELSYLDSVTNQLSICTCSSTFESIAELYTINHRLSDNLRLSKLLHFSRVQSSERISTT